jgi:lambda family phage portal protein
LKNYVTKYPLQRNLSNGQWEKASPVTILYDAYGRAMAISSGAYSGASTSRRALRYYNPKSLDADSALLPELVRLRDVSEDLARNSPLALGAINTAVTNVVGSGLKLQCRVDRDFLKMEEGQADEWETTTEREWHLWADSQDCDVARTIPFPEGQDLVFRKVLVDGDIFVLMTRKEVKYSPYALRLQYIEGDRVKNKENVSETKTLKAGIEKDEYGAPINYHIMKDSPGSVFAPIKQEWDVIPAFFDKTRLRNVIHLYRMLRPGQSRGLPYLSPVIELLKQLTRYSEAEIMAAVVSSYFTGVIETEAGSQGMIGNMVGDDDVDSAVAGSSSDQDIKLGPGALIGLKMGEKITFGNPGRPNTGFDAFVKSILQQIGVALEIPFEILIGHFSASYSASRAALLEAWRFFRGRRSWLARNFCQLVYENWLYEAVAIGRVKAPGFFKDFMIRKAFSNAIWIGEAPSQIDPMKEVDAAEKRLNLFLTTRDEETVALTGGDFEANWPRIKKEKKMLKELQPEPPPLKIVNDKKGPEKMGSDLEDETIQEAQQ